MIVGIVIVLLRSVFRLASSGFVVALAISPAVGQPIWSNPPSRTASDSIVRVSSEGDEVPPAPPAETSLPVEPAPAPTDYEPTTQAPVPPAPTIAEPVDGPPPALVVPPPLPSPAYATPVPPHMGRATVSYNCPPCPPSKRRCRCCLEGELDQRCIFGIAPHGAALRATFGAQIARADASQMMLYEYDFVPASVELNLRGQYQLAKIAAWAARSPFPIVIQSTPGAPTIAEGRRARVIEQLHAGGWVGSDERVIIGLPMSPGLHGLDALPIAERLPYATVGGRAASGSAPPTPIPAGP